MCRSVAFLAWISCVHLIFPGTSILSPKLDTPAANATQKLLATRKTLQDQLTSNSFNVFRGLYPHPHPHPLPHPDDDYPYSHQPPPAQPASHGCTSCSQPNILVVPLSGQYLNQPQVKHTIKTVITDMKEITTPLSDGALFGRNANYSFNGATKSANKEQEVQIVLPSGEYPPDEGLDLPFAGLEPIELEDNYVTGGQGFNPEKGFLFRPYGIFKPATAATLSAPGHKSAAPQVQPFSFPRPFTLPPFNLAYLRPRPVAPKEEASQQWRPSAEISYGVPARHASVNIPKAAAADPCGEPEKEEKGAKIDSKV